MPTDEAQGFRLTASLIEPYLNERTKMVFINSPSNPSGAVLDRAEFEAIYSLCAERSIYLLTDECYSHFLYDGAPFSIASLPGAKEIVLVAGTVSKTYSSSPSQWAMASWVKGLSLMPAVTQAVRRPVMWYATP